MENNRVKNSMRNSIWGILNKIVMMLGPFIFRAIIIRYIGAEYVGLNGLFKSILNVLNMTELGFNTSIVFMMYKPISESNYDEVRQLLTLMRKVYKIVGLIILGIGCCVYPFLGILVKNDTGADVNVYVLYTMYLSHTVLSYLMFAYRTSLFTAHQRNDITIKISLVREILMYAAQAAVLALTKNYYYYLLVYALMVIPQNIMYYVVSKKVFPDIDCGDKPTKEQIKTLKSKVLPLMGHRIGGKVIISIDGIIISAILGVSFLTQYDNYYYVASAIVSVFTVLRQGIMASIGNKIYTDTMDNTYVAYRRIVFIWISMVGWAAACMAGLYQPFIRLWVGEKYVYDTVTMISIVIYFFLWQFRYVGVTMKDSAGLWEPDQWKPIIGSALNLILSIIMVKVTGSVLGVLYPTMFVMIFVFFPWETYALFKHLFKRSCKDYLVLVGRCFATSAIAIVATYFVGNLFDGPSILTFVIRAAVCAVTAGAIICVLSLNLKEFKGSFNMIKRTLLKKR
ncbi:MAG: oligosaccharide flippase family protein [Clostridia bacterium]|nr:oligosaccharide flippase family protein [Clostridia bacterium]